MPGLKISAIITNYNYASYIESAILSVINQTEQAYEIIVIDDGSTDESTSIVDELSKVHKTIRLHRKKNGGQLSALRAGIEQSKGNWVFFLDADDMWLPNHLSEATKCLEADNDITLYYSGHKETAGPEVFRSKWPRGKFGPCSGLIAATGKRTGTIASNLGIYREYAQKAVFFDPQIDQLWRMRADDCLIFGASLAGAVIYYNSEQTILYRIHSNNSFVNTRQSEIESEYNNKKAALFDLFMSEFNINSQQLPQLICSELANFKQNRKNRAIKRRSMRAIRSLNISYKRRLYYYLRLLFT